MNKILMTKLMQHHKKLLKLTNPNKEDSSDQKPLNKINPINNKINLSKEEIKVEINLNKIIKEENHNTINIKINHTKEIIITTTEESPISITIKITIIKTEENPISIKTMEEIKISIIIKTSTKTKTSKKETDLFKIQNQF